MRRHSELLRVALSLGYEVVRRRGHLVVRHKITGYRTVLAFTPSSVRADRNKRKELERGGERR